MPGKPTITSFILASSNPHKAQEFVDLFGDILQISPAPHSLEVIEDGKAFTENSLLKAKAYYEAFKTPSLADDSGLVLEEFPELLGVESARFAPDLPTYPEKCKKLLEILRAYPQRSTSAYFVCVLCFYLSPDEIYFFEGRVHGRIGDELKGEHGFGYDPIFIPDRKERDGLSLAELPHWKQSFSHRAKATQAALKFFSGLKKS
jgi:XTP/dITP diphosphohydrolase